MQNVGFLKTRLICILRRRCGSGVMPPINWFLLKTHVFIVNANFVFCRKDENGVKTADLITLKHHNLFCRHIIF